MRQRKHTKKEPADKDKESTQRRNQLTKTKKAHQEGASGPADQEKENTYKRKADEGIK